MALTDAEKGQIAQHLGWTTYPQTISVTGIPVYHQIVSMLRINLERFPADQPDLLVRVRRVLCECNTILDQRSAARRRFGVEQIGEVHLDAAKQMQLLDDEYNYWRYTLGDFFGGHVNYFSLMNAHLGTSSGVAENYA